MENNENNENNRNGTINLNLNGSAAGSESGVPPHPPCGHLLPRGGEGSEAVSERKREANRRNCLKSTGPRTPEGRARIAESNRRRAEQRAKQR